MWSEVVDVRARHEIPRRGCSVPASRGKDSKNSSIMEGWARAACGKCVRCLGPDALTGCMWCRRSKVPNVEGGCGRGEKEQLKSPTTKQQCWGALVSHESMCE